MWETGGGGFAAAVHERGLSAQVVSVEDNHLREDEPTHTTEGYVIAEAQRLPFADNTFDMVVSVHALPHVAASHKIRWGTPTGELYKGKPVYAGTKEDDKKYEQERAASIAQAVRECLRVAKEGAEVRFGGVPVQKPENEFDENGFPNLPMMIPNPGAMRGFLDGIGDNARLIQYPESDKDNLFILRKLTEAERPWPVDQTPIGTTVTLDRIVIHPEFRDVAKKFTEWAADIHAAETGEVIPSNELFGRMMSATGVVDEERGARFPFGNDIEDPGYFRIPAGYWRNDTGQ